MSYVLFEISAISFIVPAGSGEEEDWAGQDAVHRLRDGRHRLHRPQQRAARVRRPRQGENPNMTSAMRRKRLPYVVTDEQP